MARGWRYFAQRMNGDGTETLLEPNLPLGDVSIEDVLSGPGGLTGKISPEIARLIGPDGRPILEEYGTSIFAESEGEIRGGGIVTHSGFSGPTWNVECTGYTGYLKDLPYTGNGVYYIEKDTLDIVRAIWHHAQSQDGGNIGLEVANTLSNVKVGKELTAPEYDPAGPGEGLTLQTQAYKLAWYQDLDLASNVDGLASDTPFDYHERHIWNGDVVRHLLDFGVPTIGRRRDDLRFVIGENIFIPPEVDRAGEDYASEAYALGAGEGASIKRGHAMRPRTRLRRVAVISDSSMRTVARANSAAAAELAWRQQLENFTNVIVRDHPHARIGSVAVGDAIYVEGRSDWIDVGAWCRVLSRSIKPDSPGVMELAVVRSDRLSA